MMTYSYFGKTFLHTLNISVLNDALKLFFMFDEDIIMLLGCKMQ